MGGIEQDFGSWSSFFGILAVRGAPILGGSQPRLSPEPWASGTFCDFTQVALSLTCR